MSNEEVKEVVEKTQEKSIIKRVSEAFKKGRERVDSFLEEHTDEEQEKKIADAVLDVIEEISDIMPYLLNKVMDFSTSRIRKRYDIPDND